MSKNSLKFPQDFQCAPESRDLDPACCSVHHGFFCLLTCKIQCQGWVLFWRWTSCLNNMLHCGACRSKTARDFCGSRVKPALWEIATIKAGFMKGRARFEYPAAEGQVLVFRSTEEPPAAGFPGASAVGNEEWKINNFPAHSAACHKDTVTTFYSAAAPDCQPCRLMSSIPEQQLQQQYKYPNPALI